MSWPYLIITKSYASWKCEKVVKFYVPTCPVFAGPVTNIVQNLNLDIWKHFSPYLKLYCAIHTTLYHIELYTHCCLLTSQKCSNYLVVDLSGIHAAPKNTSQSVFLNACHYTINYVLSKHYEKNKLVNHFIVYNTIIYHIYYRFILTVTQPCDLAENDGALTTVTLSEGQQPFTTKLNMMQLKKGTQSYVYYHETILL